MQRKGRLDWRLTVLVVAAVLIAYAAWNWPRWERRAWIAAGFGARIACSCRLIEGRDLASCRSDFRALNGMGYVRIADSGDGKGVDASVPLLAYRHAQAVPGFGCVIEGR